jgi:hypothetical protein
MFLITLEISNFARSFILEYNYETFALDKFFPDHWDPNRQLKVHRSMPETLITSTILGTLAHRRKDFVHHALAAACVKQELQTPYCSYSTTQKNRVMIQIIPCHNIDLTTLGSFKSTTF